MNKTTISISGMHCASCAQTIEKNLKKIKGIKNVNVNFASEKAYIEHDENVKKEEIEKKIKNIGYGVARELAVLKLKVIGMDNPHCISIIGSALEKIKGVKEKELLTNEKATIKFDPSLTTKENIQEKIEDVGYKNIEESEELVDIEKK